MLCSAYISTGIHILDILLQKVLQVGGIKLKKLANMYLQLQIDTNGVLAASLSENQVSCRLTPSFLSTLCQKVVWETHRQNHSGVGQTMEKSK